MLTSTAQPPGATAHANGAPGGVDLAQASEVNRHRGPLRDVEAITVALMIAFGPYAGSYLLARLTHVLVWDGSWVREGGRGFGPSGPELVFAPPSLIESLVRQAAGHVRDAVHFGR